MVSSHGSLRQAPLKFVFVPIDPAGPAIWPRRDRSILCQIFHFETRLHGAEGDPLDRGGPGAAVPGLQTVCLPSVAIKSSIWDRRASWQIGQHEQLRGASTKPLD